MVKALTITKEIHFGKGRDGRKQLREGRSPKAVASPKIPRISRVMGLAIHMQELIDAGEVEDYSELGRIAHVSRSRMSQIMRLLHLAPDIQEELLFLPPIVPGTTEIFESVMLPIADIPDWRKQRRMWKEMKSYGEI